MFLLTFATSVFVSSALALDTSSSKVNIRPMPYPFSHLVSFSSDVDMQRPWHGAAIHRVFNEEIGLTISDSLWPQGSPDSSSLFVGPDFLNRKASGVGTQPIFALLLREWHRGNIDQFHGWHEDGPIQVRNEFDAPIVMTGVRTTQRLPDVFPSLVSQHTQNVRLYFSSQPPSDLRVLLLDKQGKSISFATHSHSSEQNVQFEVGKTDWIVEIVVPTISYNSSTLVINPMYVDRIELIAPSCAKGCLAALNRVERDHFSRQTVLSQSRWLESWNIRPAIVTSHGGNTLVAGYGGEGKSMKLERTPGTFLADKATVVNREPLADRKNEHAYQSDILHRLSVRGVWAYYPEDDKHLALAPRTDTGKMSPLTSSYRKLYNVSRFSYAFRSDVSNEEKFIEQMKLYSPQMPKETIRLLYCGKRCTVDQGDALALLLSQSVYMVDHGERVVHFWYTHFGSGGSDFKHSQEQPTTPTVLSWARRFANYVYNFDGDINDARRIWSPPANTWLRYQIMQEGIKNHVRIDDSKSSLVIMPWKDPVTGVEVPERLAGTRDLHGLTLYVADPDRAMVKVAGRAVETFTRNPADASGKRSITIVDDNTPTSLVGKIAWRDRGGVKALSGEFSDTSAVKDYVTLTANQDGNASVVFKPWALDLWNISHMHLALRRQSAEHDASRAVAGSVKIELLMEDGGRIAIVDSEKKNVLAEGMSYWQLQRVGAFGEWHRHTLDVTRLIWPKVDLDDATWRRPPLPLGRVREIRVSMSGVQPGETVKIRDMKALRPSGNGEAPDGGKLVAGRVTRDGSAPLALVAVQATTESGAVLSTVSDKDGYYFFPSRKRGETLAIRARFDKTFCAPLQGRKILVLKNEAEVDIQANRCVV